jgi:hypothetical protein
MGAASGWLAGLLVRASGYGILGDSVFGRFDALIGHWLVRTCTLASISAPALPTDRHLGCRRRGPHADPGAAARAGR